MIRVVALPDWRNGNNYQGSLGEALRAEGVEVRYLAGTRRGLPLSRARYGDAQLLHLHWPEAYFERRSDGLDLLRVARFSLDLRLTLAGPRRLIYTAHNFLPHNGRDRWIVQHNYRTVLSLASGVIAHSAAAAEQLISFCPAVERLVHVLPHGDAAEHFPPLPSRADARAQLGLRVGEPMVLIFGRAEPYKGLEEIVAGWSKLHPTARLWVAGTAHSPQFAESLRQLAGSDSRVTLELRWLSDADLAVRLAASDAVLFNYRRIFTSGAGSLARSLGRKIVLPAQLGTVDLMEPSPTVFRFHSPEELPATLARAVSAPTDPAGTTTWRTCTAWDTIAHKTAAIYRAALR
jgi:beta-1,4-mannosyltransferase